MKDLEKLSDAQLIHLFQNQTIDRALKNNIIFEIDRRDLKKMPLIQEKINFKTKIKIIFSSYFLYREHVKNSSQLLSRGNKKAYKQYWRFFIYGIIFYSIILLIVAKYFLKPYFLK